MATRLIGTDSTNPRLPALVIAATQGLTADDLAAGDTLAQAQAYADAKIVVSTSTPSDPEAEIWWDPDEPSSAVPGIVLQPTGAVAATQARWVATAAQVPTSGSLYLAALELRAADVITSITFAGVAAATAPTHQWFGLFNSSLQALAFTNNALTAAWAAAAFKTLNLTAPVTISTGGLYYVGIMQTASTPASLLTSASSTGGYVMAATPPVSGVYNTGLTTVPALPFTATFSATFARMIYAYVS